jgi:hypothetical protein
MRRSQRAFDRGGKMKTAKLKVELKTQLLGLSLLAVLLAAMISGCTKPRDAALPEAVDAETFLISDLQGPTFQIATSAQAEPAAEASSKLSAIGEKPKAVVADATVPGKIAGVFRNRPVNGKLGANYPINMRISDRKYVTVSKIVKDASELSLLEQQLAKSTDAGLVVPLFKIPIKKIGVLAKVKNDIGEDTSQIEFKETEVEAATHVQVDLLPSSALDIGKDSANKKELEQIFLESRLDKKVSTYSQLVVDLQLQSKDGLDGKVYSVIDSKADAAGGKLFIYRITKLSKITDEALLRKLHQKDESNEIMACSDSILAQLDAEEQKDCVIVLAHSVELMFVQAKLALKDRNDIESPDIEIEDSLKRTGLTKIVRRTPLLPIEPGKLDPLTNIRVADIKGKEFLFRRTFEDGASTITAFGPGASGALEIVKFEMEPTRLVVRRALVVNGAKNSSNIDKEELLSIPVAYLKRAAKTDLVLTLVPASVDQAEYISLDWSQNTVPVSNSPLAFFDNGACFQSASSQTVTDLDMRMSQGMLNFSISGSYTFKPECMSFYGMNDYWYGGGLQANYNLKERLSFKLNTGENDRLSNLEIPFRAQNMLGFGIFTMDQRTPDDFGNIGGVQTERALPVIQNFENGKKMTYTLGGLPAAGEVREALIVSTQKVIQDWNAALHVAFKGSALDRAGDFIDLKIDGVDIAEGRLGDLDRNYIWNFEKNLGSGLLGMSQAAPNPRSGKIEQNNVLMYSGNLLSYIGAQKEVARIQGEYRKLKERILAEAAGESGAAAAPAAAEMSSIPALSSGQSLLNQISQKTLAQKPLTPLKLAPATAVQARIKNELMSSAKSSFDFEAQRKSALGNLGQQAYLQKIFQKAVEMGITHDENAMNALSASEVLKAYGNSLSKEERLLLSAQSRRLALMAEFEKNFAKGPACAMAPRFTNAGDLEKMSTMEIFSNWYTSTLSHEIGHSLGLTHNFQGSFDKANMKFKGEASQRNYSSIMDYIPDTHLKYGGPGPYDVHALRAIYTGQIELKDGSEISLADYKKQVLGDQSWWNMDVSHLQKMPLKNYIYCTDIHVGGDPTCNRWDMGTSGEEVATWYADEYRNLYPVLNSLGSRINIRGIDSYVSRVFMEFLALRPFMDETFLRAIAGVSDWQSYARGAIEALKVFAEVIGTPDTTSAFADSSRFEVVKSESGIMLVERKPSKDVMVPGFADRVATRGIELDKAIATIMLTSRGTGNPRYEAASIRVSFAEFEKYVLGAESASEMMSLGLIQQMLQDDVQAIASTEKGIAGLPGKFKVEVTESMRYYAILGSTLYLSADTIEDKYDFSAVFRVGSSLQTPPKDRPLLTKLDQNPASKTALKVWAFDNASSAASMVRTAAAQRIHIENSKSTLEGLTTILKANAENDEKKSAEATKALAKKLSSLNKGDVLLSKEEEKAGDSFANQIELALQVAVSQISVTTQVVAALKAGQIDEATAILLLRDRRNTIESLAKKIPMVGMAEKLVSTMVEADSLEAEVLGMINSDQDLEGNYGVVISSLQTINRFVSMLNPELSR